MVCARFLCILKLHYLIHISGKHGCPSDFDTFDHVHEHLSVEFGYQLFLHTFRTALPDIFQDFFTGPLWRPGSWL